MDYNSKIVGKRIRKLRNDKKISLKDLADRTGYESHSLGNIERGSKNPSIKTLVKICNALEVSSDDILIDYLFVHYDDKNLHKISQELSLLSKEQQDKVMAIIQEIKGS